jgi:hypothetical protein
MQISHAYLHRLFTLIPSSFSNLIRMCGALMPGHGETITEEAIWERLPVRILRVKTRLHLWPLNFELVVICSPILLNKNDQTVQF